MMRFLKWLVSLVVIAVAAALVYLWLRPPELLRVGAGYTAKIVCSNVFLAGRDPVQVQSVDVQAPGNPLLKLYTLAVDRDAGQVSAALLGFIAPVTAIYRDGYGCAVVPSGDLAGVAQLPPKPERSYVAFEWPEAPDARLDAVVSDATLVGPALRALVVVKDGTIIAERYGEGFDRDTPLLGWSMTKSVTGLLVGRAVADGTLALDQKSLFAQWQNDGRREITLANMLAMEPGLEWNEDYGDVSDVTRMLYLDDDFTTNVVSRPLVNKPGSTWLYSTGTTMALARLVQDAAANGVEYPYTALFEPMGMDKAILEVGAKGTLGGGSYLYAPARDWAKLGQLFLNLGRWNNQQLVSPSFIDMMTTPTRASGDEYGKGQIWVELPKYGLPKGTARFSGHDGQFVTIVPSERLVIVRQGLTPSRLGWEPEPLTQAVLDALKS